MPSPILTRRSRNFPILYNLWVGKEQYQQHSFLEDPQPAKEPRRRQVPADKKIREAIEPYVDIPTLRRLIAERGDIQEALRTGDIPEEVRQLLSLLETMIAPINRDQVKSPADVAGYLQLKYGHEPRECFCIICLNTKNRVQAVETLYRGTLNSAPVRGSHPKRRGCPTYSGNQHGCSGHGSGSPRPYHFLARSTCFNS